MRWHAQQRGRARLPPHLRTGPLLDVFVLDMRSYRGPNTLQPAGDARRGDGLPRARAARVAEARPERSRRATWKVIASDMPIGLIVGDGRDAQGRDRFEAVANGDGPALGRELEIAELLRFIKQRAASATSCGSPPTCTTPPRTTTIRSRAQFQDFDPFWEFVAGPLHAGTLRPQRAGRHLRPRRSMFVKAPPQGQVNLPPSAGLQFFGEVQIDARTRAMTVHLRDLHGRVAVEHHAAAASLR